MDIEIIEYYPKKPDRKGNKQGTLHVYLCDYDMDVRGCQVNFNGDKIYVRLPFFYQYDPDQERVVGYPMINLVDEKKHNELCKTVAVEGRKFVKNWYKQNNQ